MQSVESFHLTGLQDYLTLVVFSDEFNIFFELDVGIQRY